ncbi:MAG: glycosyltransferase family protein [Rhodospirillales bacterium]
MTSAMTTAITIQARMGSSRLPGKVLKDAVGKPMLELMIERLKRVPGADKIIVATTVKPADDPIVELAQRVGVNFYRGSEDDVLSRVLEAAQTHNVDVIVETTGDCPLIDPGVIQKIIDTYNATGADYVSNVIERSYPIGMDTQVFATDILADVAERTNDPQDHEHVSLFIYHHPEIYRLKNVTAPKNLTAPDWRLTLDTPEDYEMIRKVFEALYPDNPAFTLADMFKLFKKRPELLEINSHVQHNWIRKDS